MELEKASPVGRTLPIFTPKLFHFPPFLLHMTPFPSHLAALPAIFPNQTRSHRTTMPPKRYLPPRAAADAPPKKGKAEKERPEGITNAEWAFDHQRRQVENASHRQREHKAKKAQAWCVGGEAR
jgi:hypothetical protein